MSQALCSKCGKKLTGNTERVVPVPGHDPVLACPECEPEVKEGAHRMAEAMASRPRELRVARCDTMYRAIMETCSPIAACIYLSSCQKDGMIATADGLAMYEMGFVDAAWCIAQGELRMATMERTPEPAIQEANGG